MQDHLDIQQAAELRAAPDECDHQASEAESPLGKRPVWQPVWPSHDPARTARDFLFWRHLRVARARVMRHLHKASRRMKPGRDLQSAVTAYGVRMKPDWHDRTYAYCHYGTYGDYLADLLRSLDRPFQFLDIGANQGLFSLIAARNPACEAVIALEPVAETFDRLQDNIALNRLGGRAHALNFGLSDRAGDREIAKSTIHSGIATLEGHLSRSSAEIVRQPVRTETMERLAPYLREDLPVFVKIDVEGHEAVVMSQLMKSRVARRIFGLFYECDLRWSDARELERILANANFTPIRRYGRGRHFDTLAVPRQNSI